MLTSERLSRMVGEGGDVEAVQTIVSAVLIGAVGVFLARLTQGFHRELKTEIRDVRSEIRDLRSELKAEIRDVRGELSEMRSDLTRVALAVGAGRRADSQ